MPTCQNRLVASLASLIFLVGVSLAAARVVIQYQTPGPFDDSAQGMCDFHNGIYFPTRALIDGVCPYGQHYADTNPVARQIPFFSPGILVLHAPLALLPIHVAEVLYFLICVGLVLAIASVSANAAGRGGQVEWIAGIAAGIVFSRSGHITLFDGYFTFELILATLLAIRWADEKPTWSAVALAVVSAKPTYILPLGFLMLARGNYRALIYGAMISLLAATIPMVWLAYHEGIQASGQVDLAAGASKVFADIQLAQEIHMNMPDESPIYSWTRLDLLAAICKWTGSEPNQLAHLGVMTLMLIWPMLILHRRRQLKIDDGLGGATGALILLGTLSSLYHQSYDALLVTTPVAALISVRGPFWQQMNLWSRLGFLTLLLISPLNYLTTRTVLSRLDIPASGYQLLTSINGISLGIALVWLCAKLSRADRSTDT